MKVNQLVWGGVILFLIILIIIFIQYDAVIVQHNNLVDYVINHCICQN